MPQPQTLTGAGGPLMPLGEYVGSDAAATAADDGAETEPRGKEAVSSANFEESDSLPEVFVSNVLAKHLWVVELLGETKAASAHETNSYHGVLPLNTDPSADEGADDKQSDRAVDTVFEELFSVRD